MRKTFSVPSLLLLALLLLTYLCYGVTLRFGFVTFDDATHIYRNPLFQNFSFSHFLEYWKRPYEHLYIPVTYSLWSLGVLLSGGKALETTPQIFHLFNVLFHMANGAMVFWVLRHFTQSSWARFFGAGLFLFHPMQVEAVAWISALKDLLSVFWALWSMEFFFRWKDSKSRLHQAGVLVFYVLALLSKPWAVSLPLVWLILDRAAIQLLPYSALPALAIGWMTLGSQPASEIQYQVPWYLRPRVMLDSYAMYLFKLIQPKGFTINYGRNPEVALSSNAYLYGSLLTALAYLLVSQVRELKKPFLMALGVFALAILPTSGIFPFFFQKYSTVSDRFAYFAILGPIFFFVIFYSQRDFPWTRFFTGALILFLGLRSHVLLKHWTDDTALVVRTARVAPKADHFFNLAQMMALELEGKSPVPGLASRPLREPKDQEERKLWLRFIEWNYREAIRMRPDFAEAHNGLGMTLAQEDLMVQALVSFQTAVDLSPKFSLAWYNLGQSYEHFGKHQEALAMYRQASELDPSAALARAKITELEKAKLAIKD